VFKRIALQKKKRKKMTNWFKAHPWHGIDPGPNLPQEVTVFIEIVPTDTVKYEIDKASGYLKIDRPQQFSNIVPALYGFVPRTYCMESVAEYCMEKTQRTDMIGDGDPLDICVLSERDIPRGDILMQAYPVGGFRMIDDNEADDKILAVLKGDPVFDQWRDISLLPKGLVDRLHHYFLTYKLPPGSTVKPKVEITHIFGPEEAYEIIRRSRVDYENHFNGKSIKKI
jgi:inorganic pyrophosphatase